MARNIGKVKGDTTGLGGGLIPKAENGFKAVWFNHNIVVKKTDEWNAGIKQLKALCSLANLSRRGALCIGDVEAVLKLCSDRFNGQFWILRAVDNDYSTGRYRLRRHTSEELANAIWSVFGGYYEVQVFSTVHGILGFRPSSSSSQDLLALTLLDGVCYGFLVRVSNAVKRGRSGASRIGISR